MEVENFNLGDGKQWADVVVDGIEITDRARAADVLHEEYRDDRYVAALKLGAGRTARVFYLVRAVTPGTYTVRSAEHTSELQSLMRTSYAVFCLKKKNNNTIHISKVTTQH